MVTANIHGRILEFFISDGNKDSLTTVKIAVSGAFKMFDAHRANFAGMLSSTIALFGFSKLMVDSTFHIQKLENSRSLLL